jgi:hypothetical protein
MEEALEGDKRRRHGAIAESSSMVCGGSSVASYSYAVAVREPGRDCSHVSGHKLISVCIASRNN